MNHIKKITNILIVMLIATGAFMSSCRDNAWDNHISNEEQLKSNLLQVIESRAELSTFATALKATGYDELLKTANSFTVFAPNNDAWTGIDMQNEDNLRKLVGTLIVYNSYFTNQSENFVSFKAVNAKTIFYDKAAKTFNGAAILSADIRAANGVIQITDKLVERRESIWDFVSTKTDFLQYQFIKSLDKQVMDTEKSIAIGVYPNGKTKFDTIWTHVNNFLEKYPIHNEDSTYTYVILQNSGFNLLYNKYNNQMDPANKHIYFNMGTVSKTDSATRYNVCQDFVFKGIVDITAQDTLINIDGVKVPFKGATIVETYNASNGKVYVINQSNIRLKDKIKPITIEGENFYSSYNSSYVFTRYKRWASGERDIAFAGAETQTDTLWRKLTGIKDSVVTKTYFVNSGLVMNTNNFYIEYKTKVNSANYDIYYVAFDDIADHFDLTSTVRPNYKLYQKLFVSMPGAAKLKYGILDNTHGVANNYLGEKTCFVGEDTAGVHKLTKLKQWSLLPTSQLLDKPQTNDVMTVQRSGELTMWLCNTALSATASRQGLLFLDYILLVPRITEE